MAGLKKIMSWVWPQKVQIREGKISPVLEVTYENGRKVLNAAHVNYSFGALHEVFQIAFEKAGIAKRNPKQVLILGYGGGSIASILVDELKLSPEMTGVEADEEVIRIARREFDADLVPKLRLVHARAEEFVKTCEAQFDLIAVDVFVEQHVPEACLSLEFLNALNRILLPGGTIVFNRMPELPVSGKDEFQDRFRMVFPEMEILPLRLEQAENSVFSARKKSD